jgi:hypothetical protein
LKHAKVTSLSSFEKSAKSWKLSKRDGAYFIVPNRSHEDGEGVEDLERGEAIPAEERLDTEIPLRAPPCLYLGVLPSGPAFNENSYSLAV